MHVRSFSVTFRFSLYSVTLSLMSEVAHTPMFTSRVRFSDDQALVLFMRVFKSQ
jgi:hypothetical protein